MRASRVFRRRTLTAPTTLSLTQTLTRAGKEREQRVRTGALRQRGFPSGDAHPARCRVRLAQEQKAAKSARDKAQREELRAQHAHARRASAEQGLRDPLTTQQQASILSLVLRQGCTQSYAAAHLGVSAATVSRVLKRQRDADDDEEARQAAHGDVTPPPAKRARTSQGGKLPYMTPTKHKLMAAAFDSDPYASVSLIHKTVQDQGVDCSLRTFYRHLHRAGVDRMAANNYSVWTEPLVHGVYNWIDAIGAALDRGDITYHNLAYMDQTPVHILEGKRGGYSSERLYGDCGDVHGAKKVGNLWVVSTVDGPVRVWYTEENGNDNTCEDFFLSDTLPPGWTNIYGAAGNIFNLLRDHGARFRGKLGNHKRMVLCLDRLGKSGISHWCVSGHHRPEIRARALQYSVGLGNLPPKGAEVNPVELFNLLFKRILGQLEPPGGGFDAYKHKLRGPRTKEDVLAMMPKVMCAITPEAYRAFFHKRARGSDATSRFNRSEVAQRVRAERALKPVPPYNWVEEAVAKRGYTTAPDDWYPSSFQVAETYNVYFWRHFVLGLEQGLAPPFKRPVDSEDGHERTCRLCSGKGKYAQQRDTICVCCEDCTGTFHRECVGLEKVPKTAWTCPCCLRGGAPTPRVWKAPSQAANAAANPAPRRKGKHKRLASAESDDDDSAR